MIGDHYAHGWYWQNQHFKSLIMNWFFWPIWKWNFGGSFGTLYKVRKEYDEKNTQFFSTFLHNCLFLMQIKIFQWWKNTFGLILFIYFGVLCEMIKWRTVMFILETSSTIIAADMLRFLAPNYSLTRKIISI